MGLSTEGQADARAGRQTTEFDEAIAVQRAGDGQAGGTTRYQARFDERFAIVAQGGSVPAAMNGGVMIAMVLRAVLGDSPHPHPVATSAHFLRVPKLANAEVEVTWLKQGRTAATARAALVQDGHTVLDTTVTTGSVPEGAQAGGNGTGTGNGALTWTGEPPTLPPIEECVNLGPWRGTVGPDGTAGYAAHVDLRLDPATIGWRRGNPAGVPEMRGYFGLREERDPDAYLLALAVDSLPPVVFGLGAAGWAPTVELTWYMRAIPAKGPLQVAARCRHVGGGWFDEEAEVWDAAGQLVAQSRQLARVGRSSRGPARAEGN
ncbi:MAG TPA: thioesterase family protein [Streptosporangiaceae bacterium]|nr:thioesterase family protein [Streptosporangiaceae bacterium]